MAGARRQMVDKRLMERSKPPLSSHEYNELLAGLPDLRWKAMRTLPPLLGPDLPQLRDADVHFECGEIPERPKAFRLDVRLMTHGRYESTFAAYRVMLESPHFAVRTRQGQAGVRMGETTSFELDGLTAQASMSETFAVRVFVRSRPVLDFDITIDLDRLTASRY
jgi:hypothetical protein